MRREVGGYNSPILFCGKGGGGEVCSVFCRNRPFSVGRHLLQLPESFSFCFLMLVGLLLFDPMRITKFKQESNMGMNTIYGGMNTISDHTIFPLSQAGSDIPYFLE